MAATSARTATCAGIALGYDPTGGANWANIPAADSSTRSSHPGQGFVTVDSGAELQAAGFSNLYEADVTNGTLTLTGTGLNTTLGMTINNGGVLHAAATSTVSSVGGIGLGSATFNVDNTKELTVTGSLYNVASGTGSLTKTGGGSLILTGASTYTGPTTVSQGLLRVDSGGSLVSVVTVNAGGVDRRHGHHRRSDALGRHAAAGRQHDHRHAERQRVGQSARRLDVRVEA